MAASGESLYYHVTRALSPIPPATQAETESQVWKLHQHVAVGASIQGRFLPWAITRACNKNRPRAEDWHLEQRSNWKSVSQKEQTWV